MPVDKFLEKASGNVYLGTLFGLTQLANFPRMMNPYVYESAAVQKLIHSTDQHFDVVINEEFFGDGFLMFGHKFNAPIITICPVNVFTISLGFLFSWPKQWLFFQFDKHENDEKFGASDFIDRQSGLLTPPSFVSHWVIKIQIIFHHKTFK